LPLTTINITGPEAEPKAERAAGPRWLATGKQGKFLYKCPNKRKDFLQWSGIWGFCKDCGDPRFTSPFSFPCVDTALGFQLPWRTAKTKQQQKGRTFLLSIKRIIEVFKL
jgi:hypothetical protein